MKPLTAETSPTARVDRELSVLILDDNRADAQILTRHLNALVGWDVTIYLASNSLEADTLLGQTDLDIVFVDNLLGQIRGTELIAMWRLVFSNTAFVLLTGQGDEHTAAAAIRSGANDYLIKALLNRNYLANSVRLITERTREQRRLRSILNAIPDVVLMIDQQGIVCAANPALNTVFGYDPELLIGECVTKLMPDDLAQRHRAGMLRYQKTGIKHQIGTTVELTGKRANGELFPLELSLVESTQFGETFYFGTIRDITRRLKLELRNEHSSVINSTQDIVAFVTTQQTLRYLNPAGQHILNLENSDRLQSIRIGEICTPKYQTVIDTQILPALRSTGSWTGEMEINDRTTKNIIPVSVVATSIKDITGNIVTYAFVMHNITEIKMYQMELEYKVLTDPLTGLANRTHLIQELSHAIARSKRNSMRIALLYIDLDQFKSVNDSLGHDAGDDLLKQVSARMLSITRETDCVARLGGDEFVVLLEQEKEIDISGITIVAEKLITAIGKVYCLDNHEAYVTPSIGIATFPGCGASAEDLMKSADIAMYQAKQEGRNTFRYFSEEMHYRTAQNTRIKNLLNHVLEMGDFKLAYQAIVNDQQKLSGVEALLRIKHQGMLIPPGKIIAIAERNGLMCALGDLVIERALQTTAKWRTEYNFDGFISINISIIQLRQIGFAEKVQSLIGKYELPGNSILFEITETMLIENMDSCLKTLTELKKIGIRLAIDDFGSGYASLRHLLQMPIDMLKLDHSFVENIHTNQKAEKTVRAILNMANSMDLQIIIEGIETEQQHLWFKKTQNLLRQGYYYSQPATDITHLKDLMK